MTVDTVTTTKPLPTTTHDTPVTVAAKTSAAKPETKTSAPAPRGGSAMDVMETQAQSKDPATVALLKDLGLVRDEDGMMKAINANPEAFLKAVNAWASANGITGKSQDQLITMFLARLRSDLGLNTSAAGVPDDHLILLVGSDNRTNATVSAVGQMIYEKYGEAAWKDYRAKVEADWGADGKLSDSTIVMLDDALTTAKENYKPEYDASGKLVAPPPDVRIAQLYVQLGQKYGGVDPKKTYSDIAAQVLFQTGKELNADGSSGAPTPISNLLKAVQNWLSLEKAHSENQRKLNAGEITKDQYLKTESFLSVQIKEARADVAEAAKAAGVKPELLLKKDVAEGFVLGLTDPATSAQISKLGWLRAQRQQLVYQINTMGVPLAYPQMQQRLQTIKNIDAQIAPIEADLKKKGIDVSENPKAGPGDGFGGLNVGVTLVADDKLDKAYAAEQAAGQKAKGPTYGELFAKIERLEAKRAELAKFEAEEAATLPKGLADKKRETLTGEIKTLEGELSALAKSGGLPADIFTNPMKAKGYMAAAQNDDLRSLFGKWRETTAEIAKLDAEVAAEEKAGVSPDDPDHAAKRAKAAGLRSSLVDLENDIYAKIYGVDPKTSAELEQKRAERDAAGAKVQEIVENEGDSATLEAARAEWNTKIAEVKELEKKLVPPATFKNDVKLMAEGAAVAETSSANAGYKFETDAAYRAGYASVGHLSKEQGEAVDKFIKSFDAAAADKELTEEERIDLVAQYRGVAAFMPPGFFGAKDTSALAPTDGAWLEILSDSRNLLANSFIPGANQRTTDLQAENEKMVLAADVPTLLAKLTEASDGKLKGESATAHTQYVLQMLGVAITKDDMDTFLKGGKLSPAKQKAMEVAAQFFAQSQGQKLDGAAALNLLRNALSADMGKTTSDPKVDTWEEYTFAGTDNPEVGPATPQTEFLRSMMSVMHEIYAEVYGKDAAAALDKKVDPRFYDGAIVPVNKTTNVHGDDRTNFDHYELSKDNWDPATGQVTGFKDKPWVNVEWSFEVVLTKTISHPSRGGTDLKETKVERVNPNDQKRIAELKADGYAIDRVDAKPASEPQRMFGRLIEGLMQYMKTYKPVYDADGKLTNPPPLARIAQYYVQTEFEADLISPDEGKDRFKNYRIEKTGLVMTDAEAIEFMFKELGMEKADIDTLLGVGGKQLNSSSTLYDPQSDSDKIFQTVVDSVFTFGMMGFIDGLIDKTTTDPLTDFGNDKLGDKHRDNWRSENRDKMDDPSAFNLVFDTLMFAAPDVLGGFVFTIGGAAGRLARKGADVADAAGDGTRGAAGKIWTREDRAEFRGADDVTGVYDFGYPGWTDTKPGTGRPIGEADEASSSTGPLPRRVVNPHQLEIEPADDVPVIATRTNNGLAPPLTDGSPAPKTDQIYKWSSGVTYETPAGNLLKPTGIPGISKGLDATGKEVNYALMLDPDGKSAYYVKVDQKEVSPATADRPAEYEFRIYNPSEGANSIKTMPKLKWDQEQGVWTIPNTTLVRSPEYNKLIDSGAYISDGRIGNASTYPGMATNKDLLFVRNPEGELVSPIRAPEQFSYNDPKEMLSKNGKAFLEKNKEKEKLFLKGYDELKAQNELLQIALQRARESKDFWQGAVSKLEDMKLKNPKMTWADVKKADPQLASAMEKRGLTLRTFEEVKPETPINTLIDGAKAKRASADADIIKANDDIIANAKRVDSLVTQYDGEGNAKKTRHPKFITRNAAIAAAVGVSVIIGTGATGAVIGKEITKKGDPPKEIDKTEKVPLGKDSQQTVDIAELAGTKGKGYTYEIAADQVRGKGASIDPKTGKLTLSTKDNSVLLPGETTSFSVLIKDSKGNLKGRVTIDVTVAGEKGSQVPVEKEKPVVIPTKTVDLPVTSGTPVTLDVAKQLNVKNAASYQFDPASTVPKGLTLDAKTGQLTAADGKDSGLEKGKSYPVTILVKGAKNEDLGKVTVNVKVS